MERYLPEGCLWNTVENAASLRNAASLQERWREGRILEARVTLCDSGHNLIVDLVSMKGIIPKEERRHWNQDGSTKDIALISRVNKAVCFRIQRFDRGANGEPVAILSRRQVQEECMERYVKKLHPATSFPFGSLIWSPLALLWTLAVAFPPHPYRRHFCLSHCASSGPVFSRPGNPSGGTPSRAERPGRFKPQGTAWQLGRKTQPLFSREKQWQA